MRVYGARGTGLCRELSRIALASGGRLTVHLLDDKPLELQV